VREVSMQLRTQIFSHRHQSSPKLDYLRSSVHRPDMPSIAVVLGKA
jgi:hypothetical protein